MGYSYLVDVGYVLTLSDRRRAAMLTPGYRWDYLRAWIAVLSAVGTVGVSVAAQPLVAQSGVVLYGDAGFLRYIGAALQSVVLFWLALLAVAAIGSEALHQIERWMGWDADRNHLALAMACATAPIAARSAILGAAALVGVDGIPVFPWTVLDPTPVWAGLILYLTTAGIVQKSVRIALSLLVNFAGYAGLVIVGLAIR